MKNFTKDLKRILSALAYEDAGDFLSHRNKMSLLSSGHIPTHTPIYSSIKAEHKPEVRLELAVIFDGHASDQVINYLQNKPYVSNSHIIILAHGDDPELQQKTTALSQQLENIGRHNSITYLLEDISDAFQEFCNENPDLQYLVAPWDDKLAKEIINNEEFHSHSHEIPMILIKDNERRPTSQSATVA